MDNKTYTFKDVSGSLNSPIVFACPSEGEPISVGFTYFDKEGIAWKVQTQGYRVKTGEVKNTVELDTIKYVKWPICSCGGIAVDNASGDITRTCIRCGAIVEKM